MNRETKRNLIFVVILLALLLPGAIILFNKKMGPDSRIMYLPESAPHEAAFIDPLMTADRIVRVAPELTRQWTADVTTDLRPAQIALRPVADGTMMPLVTENRAVQVAQIRPHGNELDLVLLVWDPAFENPSADNFFCAITLPQANSHPLLGKITSVQPLELPKNVYHDLQNVGYVRPPQVIYRVDVQWVLSPASGPVPSATSGPTSVPATTLPAAALPATWSGPVELSVSMLNGAGDTARFSIEP